GRGGPAVTVTVTAIPSFTARLPGIMPPAPEPDSLTEVARPSPAAQGRRPFAVRCQHRLPKPKGLTMVVVRVPAVQSQRFTVGRDPVLRVRSSCLPRESNSGPTG